MKRKKVQKVQADKNLNAGIKCGVDIFESTNKELPTLYFLFVPSSFTFPLDNMAGLFEGKDITDIRTAESLDAQDALAGLRQEFAIPTIGDVAGDKTAEGRKGTLVTMTLLMFFFIL